MDEIEIKVMPVGSKLDDLLSGFVGRILKSLIGESAFDALAKIKDMLAAGTFPDLTDGHSAGALFMAIEGILAGIKDSFGIPVLATVDNWMLGFKAGINGQTPMPLSPGVITFGGPAEDLAASVTLPANPTANDIRAAVTERAGKMKAFPAFLIPILIEMAVAILRKWFKV